MFDMRRREFITMLGGVAARHLPKREPRPSPKGAWCGLNVL